MVSETEATTATTAAPLEGEALLEAVRKQIEYYFSKQNLSSDSYLFSMMDPELYVGISLIAGFAKLKALCTDVSVIVEAVKTSDLVMLDETCTKIRPKVQQKRSTLILRDIPTTTPLEEVQALFSGSKAPESVRPDIMNTWFVSFESENDTMAALEFLRKGVQFQGKPVKCAVKSETVLKSLYYSDSRPQYGAGDAAAAAAATYTNRWTPNDGNRRRQGGGGGSGPRRTGGNGGGANASAAAPNAASSSATSASNASSSGGRGGAPQQQDASGAQQQQGRGKGSKAGGPAGGPAGGRRPRKEGALLDKPVPPPPAQVVLSSAHFPPLPSNYSKGFKKYTKEQILDIIRSTEPARMETMDGSCVVVLPAPDIQLEAERVGEHDRRVSMDFDLSHIAKQVVHSIAPSGVKEDPSESHADDSDHSSATVPSSSNSNSKPAVSSPPAVSSSTTTTTTTTSSSSSSSTQQSSSKGESPSQKSKGPSSPSKVSYAAMASKKSGGKP